MIFGVVNDEEVPIIKLSIGGRDWPAIVDTGFNGDLELPDVLRDSVNPRFEALSFSTLAGGQAMLEDLFLVDFSFDGHLVEANATFVSGSEILIGTHLIRDYRLEIDFPNRTVQLTRTRGGHTGP